MQSNDIFHFYCSLYLFILGTLIEFHLLSHLPVAQQFGKHCHLQVHFATAAYKILNWEKWWYRTIWNIIYTGTFSVPVYRASLSILSLCLYRFVALPFHCFIYCSVALSTALSLLLYYLAIILSLYHFIVLSIVLLLYTALSLLLYYLAIILLLYPLFATLCTTLSLLFCRSFSIPSLYLSLCLCHSVALPFH